MRDGELPKSRNVFIDVELCAFNLETYARELWAPAGLERLSLDDGGIPKVDSRLRMPYIWVIMIQLASAIHFIHSLRQIHRNLKPRNGISSNKQF